jgi:hypothetical protein
MLLFHITACRVRLLSPAAAGRLPVARMAVRTWPLPRAKLGGAGRLFTRAAPSGVSARLFRAGGVASGWTLTSCYGYSLLSLRLCYSLR